MEVRGRVLGRLTVGRRGYRVVGACVPCPCRVSGCDACLREPGKPRHVQGVTPLVLEERLAAGQVDARPLFDQGQRRLEVAQPVVSPFVHPFQAAVAAVQFDPFAAGHHAPAEPSLGLRAVPHQPPGDQSAHRRRRMVLGVAGGVVVALEDEERVEALEPLEKRPVPRGLGLGRQPRHVRVVVRARPPWPCGRRPCRCPKPSTRRRCCTPTTRRD